MTTLVYPIGRLAEVLETVVFFTGIESKLIMCFSCCTFFVQIVLGSNAGNGFQNGNLPPIWEIASNMGNCFKYGKSLQIWEFSSVATL